ncbi:MAG: ribonuclease Z [Candidatus Woesearchaeota archaeon]|jgi:ribonuclease Z|nr:ribonuclease Z [Candidatus Woesearchaeota archaeon]MDP7622975.1 ribonuclease Z [Candidatus Woesearchaeota archaeon]HJN56394.1 ribonuclease Z [Candidatus Woesearchaeota archaeon]|tara:strand:- start:16676 stop:17566 length:891 start_codon:yes stop_codon:yes gene_type:complete
MQILFLGTSSMVPTKERNQSAVLVSYGSEGILVDCGEGTQRQLKIAGVKLTKITKILISHLHGDHVLGLPGMIQSMSSADYNDILNIYGPVGTKKFVENLFKTFLFDRKIEIQVRDIKSGRFSESDDLILEAQSLEHNVDTLGYSIIEKDKRKINLKFTKKLGIPDGPLLGKLQDGKNIVWKGKKINVDDATDIVKGKKATIISDTVPCKGADMLAKDSDLLISEATYASDLEDKSIEYGHMTSKQAAELANRTGSKKLVLTHFSARYKNTLKLEEDARDYFDDVLCAEDFMKINL